MNGYGYETNANDVETQCILSWGEMNLIPEDGSDDGSPAIQLDGYGYETNASDDESQCILSWGELNFQSDDKEENAPNNK